MLISCTDCISRLEIQSGKPVTAKKISDLCAVCDFCGSVHQLVVLAD